MSDIVSQCIDSYSRLKHLKLTADEVGIPWQTVYVHLKKAGIPVVGDKSRYGSVTDRFATKAELRFKESVKFAVDNNESEFQSSVDFSVLGYTVDVKAAALKDSHFNKRKGKYDAPRWGFCINKQRDTADFFVLYAYDKDGESVEHVFLLPNEIATAKTTISISASLKSKWADYKIEESELPDFFASIGS